MAKHVISVCIFCFICATHSPCASHAGVGHENTHKHFYGTFNDPNNPPVAQTISTASREKIKPKNLTSDNAVRHFQNIVLGVETKHIHGENGIQTTNKLVKRNSDEIVNHTVNTNREDARVLPANNSKEDENYLKKLFLMYGDGNSMTIDGFKKLMQQLDFTRFKIESKDYSGSEIKNETKRNFTCINRDKIFASLVSSEEISGPKNISNDTLQKACPAILYSMVVGGCVHEEVAHLHLAGPVFPEQYTTLSIWFYSNLAVVLISACGVLGLAVIPVMQKRFYQPLLQFLVALAVGTLAGDAFLHLLPHAMSASHAHEHNIEGGHSHIHSHGHSDDPRDGNMWKGFATMLGLTFFFLMERIVIFLAKWRKGQVKKMLPSRIKIMKPDGSQPTKSNERQCMNKYSSFPLCYNEILENEVLDIPDAVESLYTTDTLEADKTATTILDELGSHSNANSFKKSRAAAGNNRRVETNQNLTECPGDNAAACTEVNKMLANDGEKDQAYDYTVILREHENRHHGHSHMHGHVHAAPKNMSSVAWMVIMGDGLHNFTDGMAIGAAFAGSIAGGFSTAVAVFCHELPHELGDFAMLLKAGMSMKQALFYNLLSSVLCLFGNAFGVWLGNTEYASKWIFAAAAGMFVYIALVDMIPELSSGHEDEGKLVQNLLHMSGLMLGVTIMTIIAMYEHDLKNIFHDPV